MLIFHLSFASVYAWVVAFVLGFLMAYAPEKLGYRLYYLQRQALVAGRRVVFRTQRKFVLMEDRLWMRSSR